MRHRFRLRWRAGLWRLGHVRRRVAGEAARGCVEIISRAPRLRRLPRRLVAGLEAKMLRLADETPFDGALYLERNPDVGDAGADPLAHYLRYGWAEGRDPNGWFGDTQYRRQAGLLPQDNISALAHYLALGRRRGLGPRRGNGAEAVRPAHPAAEANGDAAAGAALARLARVAPRAGAAARVDVIVPVYKGRAETLNCLASVLCSANQTRSCLVVVDDAGPDARLRADLALLARRGLIELVSHRRNLGFVASVNAGMRLRRDRDVIWLNADTEVAGDWIDRLRRAAYSAPDIATVTPLTNNGTICGYPRFNTDNCEALEVEWREVDRLAATVNTGQTVDAPTCVGFATYVRRDALKQVGPLDEAVFGRGYGEENDFSRRAAGLGLRNVIAGDVFVRHLGQTSFGDERAERVAAALRHVERLHPGYGRAVAAFAAADPVAPLRRAIDMARLRRLLDGKRRKVLIVTHSLGGGTRQHVEEETARLRAGGAGVVLMSGGAGGGDTVRIGHPEAADMPALEAVPLGGRGLVELLGQLGVTEVRLHHLADFGGDAMRRFVWLLDALGVPFEVTVHDYLAICPRINLADGVGMYCGEPGEAGCRRCLSLRRSAYGAPDIRRWRRDHGALLAMARIVRVPDRDVAARLRSYFPKLANVVVRPHERLRDISPKAVLRDRRPGPPRVAVIGAIGPIKGFDVLIDLAVEMRARERTGNAAALTVIGYTRNDAAARAVGITVTGQYRNGEIAGLIEAADPDLILIPSIWPETYCYALSHALASGRAVAGFDIGAVGTRLRAAGEVTRARCTVLPLRLAREPAALLSAVVAAAGIAESGPADRRGELAASA